MIFRSSMITSLFAVAFAAASVGVPDEALAGKGGTNRPIKGFATGAVQIVGGSQTTLDVVITYKGKASHLGRFTRSESLHIDFSSKTLSGTITFWAANGDELYVSLEGRLVGPAEAAGTYTVTGGTGRFSGATGEAQFRALTDLITAEVAFEGEISY